MQTSQINTTLLCYSPILDRAEEQTLRQKGKIEVVTYLNSKKEKELAQQLGMGENFRLELNVAPLESLYETFCLCRFKNTKERLMLAVDAIRLLYIRTGDVTHAYKWSFRLRLVDLSAKEKADLEKIHENYKTNKKIAQFFREETFCIYLSDREMAKVKGAGLNYITKPLENKYVQFLLENAPAIFPEFTDAPIDSKVLKEPFEVLLIGEGGDFKSFTHIVSVTKSKLTNRQQKDKNASPSILFYFSERQGGKDKPKTKKKVIVIRRKRTTKK